MSKRPMSNVPISTSGLYQDPYIHYSYNAYKKAQLLVGY